MSDNYTVTKEKEGFWIIEERGERDIVRIFVFEGTQQTLVIDTGFGGFDLKSLVESLTTKPIIVALTHGDPDHTGSAEQFGEVYLHVSDFGLYREFKGDNVKLKPLYENDVIDIGGLSFTVIHIPGHTPGSVAFLDKENRIIFAGDTVNDGNIFMVGNQRSFDGFAYSVQRLLSMDDLYDTIYCSHGTAKYTSGFLPVLIEAATEVYKGNVEGFDVERGPMKLKCFVSNKITFLR